MKRIIEWILTNGRLEQFRLAEEVEAADSERIERSGKDRMLFTLDEQCKRNSCRTPRKTNRYETDSFGGLLPSWFSLL